MTEIRVIRTMEKKIINTNEAPAPIGPYSQAVQVGELLFISGQVAINPASGRERIGEALHVACRGSPSKADWRLGIGTVERTAKASSNRERDYTIDAPKSSQSPKSCL